MAPERFGRMPGRCERVNENSTAFHRRCAPGDGLSIDTAVLPAARTSVSKPDQHHAVHALKPGMLMRSLPLPNRPEFRPLAQQAINHTFIFLWIQGTGEIGQLPPRRKAASKRVKQAELQIRKLRKLFRSASILAPDVRAAANTPSPLHGASTRMLPGQRASGGFRASARQTYGPGQPQAAAESRQMPQARKGAIGTQGHMNAALEQRRAFSPVSRARVPNRTLPANQPQFLQN